jgi:hypothetical protein
LKTNTLSLYCDTQEATSPQRQQHYEQQQQQQQQQRSAKQRSATKLNTLTLSTTAATTTTANAAMHSKSTVAAAADSYYTDLTKDRGTPRVLKVWGDVQTVELVDGNVTRQTLQKKDNSSAAQVYMYIVCNNALVNQFAVRASHRERWRGSL